ncbi:hypothetical protein BGX33_007582 [Mortierella sp. NVP41]|nr:hypothetical protein BGX33_007582 [Mortierella sp. NVP41]
MDATSFGDLPYEVQTMIIQLLKEHDVAICTRVCRDWKSVFNPFVWRHIGSRRYQDSWNSRILESTAAGSLRRNGHLIQSVVLESSWLPFVREFLKHCPQTLPQLTKVEVDGMENDDGLITSLINRSAVGWTKFDIISLHYYARGDGPFGSKSLKALLKHAPTLEIVRLKAHVPIQSKDIQRLLCSMPRLKELDLLSTDGRDKSRDSPDWYRGCGEQLDGCNGLLDAQDVVGPDWVCTSLEVFRCQIGGIPRPDITRDILFRSAQFVVKSGTRHESLDLHHRVYSQLARLTRLRELTLSVPLSEELWGYEKFDKETHRIYDCLAMSLESGLDMLKDLKEMRVVGVEDMEVGIECKEEQDWVAEHWPHATIGYTDYDTDRNHEIDLRLRRDPDGGWLTYVDDSDEGGWPISDENEDDDY